MAKKVDIDLISKAFDTILTYKTHGIKVSVKQVLPGKVVAVSIIYLNNECDVYFTYSYEGKFVFVINGEKACRIELHYPLKNLDSIKGICHSIINAIGIYAINREPSTFFVHLSKYQIHSYTLLKQ